MIRNKRIIIYLISIAILSSLLMTSCKQGASTTGKSAGTTGSTTNKPSTAVTSPAVTTAKPSTAKPEESVTATDTDTDTPIITDPTQEPETPDATNTVKPLTPYPTDTPVFPSLSPYVPPSFTPEPGFVAKMDMDDAFALLLSKWENNSLKLYSYSAAGVSIDGKSNNFQISGYNAADGAMYSLDLKDNVYRLDRMDHVDVSAIPAFLDISLYRETADLVADVTAQTSGVWDDAIGRINLSIAMMNATVGAVRYDIGIFKVPYLKSSI